MESIIKKYSVLWIKYDKIFECTSYTSTEITLILKVEDYKNVTDKKIKKIKGHESWKEKGAKITSFLKAKECRKDVNLADNLSMEGEIFSFMVGDFLWVQ